MKKPDIALQMQLAGRYNLKIYRGDGTLREELEFDNLILDAGLDRTGTAAIGGFLHVGTNTTEPAVTDTALLSRFATSSTLQASGASSGSSPYYQEYYWTYRFTAGTFSGTTLAEIGIGWIGSGSYNCWSRARIKDAGGANTTITLTAEEYLDASYILRIYPPAGDTTNVVTISGTSYTFTLRASKVTDSTFWSVSSMYSASIATIGSRSYQQTDIQAYDGTVGAVTTIPSGTAATALTNNYTYSSYSNGTYYRDSTTAVGLNNFNNIGGTPGNYISAMAFPLGCGYFQFGVTPDLQKTSSKTMSLTFRLTWARKTL